MQPWRTDLWTEGVGEEVESGTNGKGNIETYIIIRKIDFIVQSLSHVQLCDPHGQQHARPPCLSPTPEAYSISCPSSQWCHPPISSSVVPFSSHLQSFPASGYFPRSQFTSGGQSIGASASASVFSMNIQDWFPWRSTDWISWQSKGLSRVFSNTTVQKQSILQHSAFFMVQLSHPYLTTGEL